MSFLKVEALSKSYGKSEVLHGIDFELNKGELLSIIGSSGGGKTTLLRCLNFLEIPEHGKISVGGELIFDGDQKAFCTEKKIAESRLHFGLVFQSFNLFPQYTLFENVTLAPRLLKKASVGEINEIAEKLISDVGLYDKKDLYPYQLSGGQQQRAAIARALAMSPDILCFDEPTSALDPELTGEVLRVISSLRDDGCTMIVVTHEMTFAKKVSDRLIFIEDGKVADAGDPMHIFGDDASDSTKRFISGFSEII